MSLNLSCDYDKLRGEGFESASSAADTCGGWMRATENLLGFATFTQADQDDGGGWMRAIENGMPPRPHRKAFGAKGQCVRLFEGRFVSDTSRRR